MPILGAPLTRVWTGPLEVDNAFLSTKGAVVAAAIITSSGGHETAAYVRSGTSWNPNWAADYGPDVDRAKKAKRVDVERAVEALQKAPVLEPIEEAQELAKRSLVSELMSAEADKIVLMTAYYEYVRWRARWKADDERAAEILLL